MRVQQRKRSAKVFIAGAIIVAILIVAGFFAYAYVSKSWPFRSNTDTTQQAGDNQSINYDKPTEQEIKEGQDAKKNIVEEEKPTEPNQSAPDQKQKKTPVDVGISYADVSDGRLEIRAFTNGVIEGTGTCTAAVVFAGAPAKRVTKSSQAFIDTSSTLCRPIYIPTSELRPGTWKVTVTFSSPDHEGTSDSVEVKVP